METYSTHKALKVDQFSNNVSCNWPHSHLWKWENQKDIFFKSTSKPNLSFLSYVMPVIEVGKEGWLERRWKIPVNSLERHWDVSSTELLCAASEIPVTHHLELPSALNCPKMLFSRRTINYVISGCQCSPGLNPSHAAELVSPLSSERIEERESFCTTVIILQQALSFIK